MSTDDVPGFNPIHNDELAMGCWAEHEDGSLIFVESTEGNRVIYSMFDLDKDPIVEYRDAMSEKGFKERFSHPNTDKLEWTWHDKTEFPWDRVMDDFPAGEKTSAVATLTAAARVAQSLELRAQEIQERHNVRPTPQREARTIMERLRDATRALKA